MQEGLVSLRVWAQLVRWDSLAYQAGWGRDGGTKRVGLSESRDD